MDTYDDLQHYVQPGMWGVQFQRPNRGMRDME